jgi:hypothetical protein
MIVFKVDDLPPGAAYNQEMALSREVAPGSGTAAGKLKRGLAVSNFH